MCVGRNLQRILILLILFYCRLGNYTTVPYLFKLPHGVQFSVMLLPLFTRVPPQGKTCRYSVSELYWKYYKTKVCSFFVLVVYINIHDTLIQERYTYNVLHYRIGVCVITSTGVIPEKKLPIHARIK